MATKSTDSKQPRVLPAAQPAQPAPQQTEGTQAVTTNGTSKARTKRADITDALPSDAQFSATAKECDRAWQHIVKSLKDAGVAVGTSFKTPQGETFTADLLAYPFRSVLRLAQSRQHNKLMDGYSDPSEPVIATVREIDAELIKGSWSQRGEGKASFTLLELAVAKHYGVEPQVAKDSVMPRVLKDVKEADLKEALAETIEEIRVARASERLAAKRAKGGGKKIELPKLT